MDTKRLLTLAHKRALTRADAESLYSELRIHLNTIRGGVADVRFNDLCSLFEVLIVLLRRCFITNEDMQMSTSTTDTTHVLAVTERDAILRERAAFCAGRVYERQFGYDRCVRSDSEAATNRYPLPRVTRPRVIRDNEGDAWRISPAGGFQFRTKGGEWCSAVPYMTPEFIRAIGDLLANPTETVESDD